MDLGKILKNFYYVPQPYLIKTQIEYPNVNKDKKLRKKVVIYYQDKIADWIKNDSSWKSLKKLKVYSDAFPKKLYKILRKYVKRSSAQWYDLIDNKRVLKDYLRYQLGK